jgi:hypothetical protein
VSAEPRFSPAEIVEVLARHRAQYVLVGGLGARAYGALRTTQDLDLCPEWSEANLDRLAAALTELRAALSIGPHETLPVPLIDGQLLSGMQIGNWQTRAGRVDVLRSIPSGEDAEADYGQLVVTAKRGHAWGHEVLVASLPDIVRSKRIAGRPKDIEALPELDQLLDDAPSLRNLDQ